MASKKQAAIDEAARRESVKRIREDLKDWEPGKWAEEVDYGPTCTCNLRGNKVGCVKHDGLEGST